MLKRHHLFAGAIHITPKNIDKKIVINFDILPTKTSCVNSTKYVHLIGSEYDIDSLCVNYIYDVVAQDCKNRRELYITARAKLAELLTKIGLIHEPVLDIWKKKEK